MRPPSPERETVGLDVDLNADMHSPPLLAGGTGTWWYGIPENHDYPSRSYHYVQATKRLTGTLELEQPDGTILHEKVVPEGSSMIMVREYDATPEDLSVGLGASAGHPDAPALRVLLRGRNAVGADLPRPEERRPADGGDPRLPRHEEGHGHAVHGAGPAHLPAALTLRLPSGESVPLNDKLRVEHLEYRNSVGRVPTFWVAVKGFWTQGWKYRMSYPGGTEQLPGGKTVAVPAFDLGVTPQLDEVPVDDRGNGNTQRFAYLADGNWGGCPVHGFGWSELIIQWRGREGQDPWWTGGGMPEGSEKCGPPPTPPVGPARGHGPRGGRIPAAEHRARPRLLRVSGRPALRVHDADAGGPRRATAPSPAAGRSPSRPPTAASPG